MALWSGSPVRFPFHRFVTHQTTWHGLIFSYSGNIVAADRERGLFFLEAYFSPF